MTSASAHAAATPPLSSSCFHCGEPVPPGSTWTVAYHQSLQPVCCIGCQSIANAIISAGAQSYYEQRSAQGLDIQTLESLAPWAQLLDDPQWNAQHVQLNDQAQENVLASAQTTLAIEGLRCGACAWLIEKILAQTPGVVRARANASTARLFIEWQPTRIALSAIAQQIHRVGYALLPLGSAPLEQMRRASDRIALRRLFVAGLASAQIMMYAYPEYLEGGGLDDDIRSLMRTASLLITIPVMVYSATPFFESAWRAVRQRQLSMDVPVSLGLIIAFTASVWAWMRHTGEVYFDSVSMFVFLLLGARWVEAKIRARTSSQREKLATALPTLAHRIAPDVADVAPWNLRIGDRVRVNSGDRLPADGLLRSATTDVDQSWLTGEALPVTRHRGDRMTEGSVNLGPAIEIDIDTPPSQGTLSRLSQLAEQAATDRPRWVAWADRIGGYFTAGILVLTVGLIAVSIGLGQGVQQWLPSVIAVLVVTCPCALSMAGPAAYAAALARLLEGGIAVSSSQTLERLTAVRDVIFDKTGTLTDPSRSDVQMGFGDPALWPTIAAIAQESAHPLAQAIAHTARREMSARGLRPLAKRPEHSQSHAGLGIHGDLDGQHLRLGAQHFVQSDPPVSTTAPWPADCTVFFSIDGVIRAGFSIQDTLRPESLPVVQRMRAFGMRVWCLSGDQPQRVARLAQSLSLDPAQAIGHCTPDAKKERVKALQDQGHITLMVGDGHNDAPVLAQADVSIAVNSAAPLARQKADIYLVGTRLTAVADTIGIAHRAHRILNQNLAWALAYNVVAIPFAALGMISPLVASVGMAASSLLVVLNSARLLRH